MDRRGKSVTLPEAKHPLPGEQKNLIVHKDGTGS